MMKQLFFWLLIGLISIEGYAQNSDELFSEANTLYKNGKYIEAITLYEKIASSDTISSELFYNLGNCYYKLNKVAPSIYNYEIALKLDPLNEDAKNNLIFAKRLTLDRIEELPKSVFQKLSKNILTKLTFNGWAIFSIILSFISALLFLLYYFSQNSTQKRVFFTTSTLSIIGLMFTISVAFQQFNTASKIIEAIIYSEEVSVKNEPTKAADEAFILHEGTKVFVEDEVDDWKKIRLIDGKVGWLKNNSIKLLNNF